MVVVRYKVLSNGEGLPPPSYATNGSAGLDLYAATDEDIWQLEHKIIPTGISIQLPKGFEAQIRPRSGLASKHKVTVLNSPGTIDGDYRGEVKVILVNYSSKPFIIKRGDRIAQMVIMPVPTVTLLKVDELSETERNEGGFGSSGGCDGTN